MLNGAVAALSFITTIVLANAMGVARFGEYVFFLASGQYLLVFAQFGTEKSLVRDLLNNPKLFRGVTYAAVVIGSLSLCLAFSALVIGLALTSYLELGGVLLAFGVGLRGLSIAGAYDVSSRISAHALLLGAERLGYLSLVWVLLLAFREHLSLPMLGVAMTGTAILLLAGQFIWSQLPGPRPSLSLVRLIAKDMAQKNSWLLLAALTALTAGSFSKIIMRPLAGSVELGAYGAAWQIVVAGSIVTTQILRVGRPELASLIASGANSETLSSFLAKYSFGAFGVAVLVALPAILFPDWIIKSLFHAEFANAAGPLPVLALLVIVVPFERIANQYLVLTSRERVAAVMTIVPTLGSLALFVILIPRFGGRGAAWAVLISGLVSTCLATWLVLSDLSKRASSGGSTLVNQNLGQDTGKKES